MLTVFCAMKTFPTSLPTTLQGCLTSRINPRFHQERNDAQLFHAPVFIFVHLSTSFHAISRRMSEALNIYWWLLSSYHLEMLCIFHLHLPHCFHLLQEYTRISLNYSESGRGSQCSMNSSSSNSAKHGWRPSDKSSDRTKNSTSDSQNIVEEEADTDCVGFFNVVCCFRLTV